MTPLDAIVAAALLAVQMNGRILTPNGDGVNDSVVFNLADTPAGLPRAQVYDVRGRRVAELAPVSPTQLRWDGRDYAGRAVESGVYLVQISEDSALWNGVVAVAR
jgi:hypothetical protein